MALPAFDSRYGRRTRRPSPWPASSTIGTRGATPCGGMRTRAVRDGNHYILNGEKTWITSGTIADVALVWAKSDEHGGKVRGFLVEKGTPGFTSSDIKGKFSLRASVTSSLALSDVRIPDRKSTRLNSSHR